eukprot:3657273-Alexandrium_andersonii.AAC.1
MSTFRANAHTAGGPDGWLPGELAAIPLRACEYLADFLNLVEEGEASWPRELRHARCAYVGKGEGTQLDPMRHRGLLVLSVVYRTWAKYRLRSVAAWAKSWHKPCLYAGFKGQGAEDAWMHTALRLEKDKAQNTQVSLLVADIY